MHNHSVQKIAYENEVLHSLHYINMHSDTQTSSIFIQDELQIDINRYQNYYAEPTKNLSFAQTCQYCWGHNDHILGHKGGARAPSALPV